MSVYAKLAGAMSVEYVDIHGKNSQTGAGHRRTHQEVSLAPARSSARN